MPKDSTKAIQRKLAELGSALGFIAKTEYPFAHINDSYSPRFDVVWFLDISQFNFEPIFSYIDAGWHCFSRQVPIAAFEIEGSTTTSKNQVGNFANLIMSPALYNFVVVNNSAASNENDTYRRGVKICRTIKTFCGDGNFIFLDSSHIEKLAFKVADDDKKIYIPERLNSSRSGSGGETISVALYDKIFANLTQNGMGILQNYSPMQIEWQYAVSAHYNKAHELNDIIAGRQCIYDPVSGKKGYIKCAKDYYYTPKLDVTLAFYLPESFKAFLVNLADILREEAIYYPCLYYYKMNPSERILFPYLGIEIETTRSKHMNGGVINLGKFFFMGLLVSSHNSVSHLNTLKTAINLRNVFYRGVSL